MIKRQANLFSLIKMLELDQANFISNGEILQSDEAVMASGELARYALISFSPEDNGYSIEPYDDRKSLEKALSEFVKLRASIVAAALDLDTNRQVVYKVSIETF